MLYSSSIQHSPSYNKHPMIDQLKYVIGLFSICCVSLVNASPYQLNLGNELIYLGAGASMSLIGYVNEQKRDAPNLNDIAIQNKNPDFEQRFTGNWNTIASKMSDVMLYAGVLSPLSLASVIKDDYFILTTMYLETIALTGGGMALTKGSITRYRPYTYDKNAPLSAKLSRENNRSFFSGHAALATSGFVFSATVFSDYYPNSKYKSLVWASAIAASATTGILRVAAGKHFPSDVLVGFAWGAAIGYWIPTLHKKERDFMFFPFDNGRQRGVGVMRVF